MSNQEVETSSSKSDLLLVTLAALLAIAGVVGFALLSEEALAIRLGVLGGGLVLAVIIAWFSPSGKRFLIMDSSPGKSFGALYGPLARKRSIRPA